MKRTFTYNVVQTVEVTLDDDGVNDEYLKGFNESMWSVDSIEDIAEYIARQTAMFPGYSIEFVPDNFEAKVVNDYVEEE